MRASDGSEPSVPERAGAMGATAGAAGSKHAGELGASPGAGPADSGPSGLRVGAFAAGAALAWQLAALVRDPDTLRLRAALGALGLAALAGWWGLASVRRTSAPLQAAAPRAPVWALALAGLGTSAALTSAALELVLEQTELCARGALLALAAGAGGALLLVAAADSGPAGSRWRRPLTRLALFAAVLATALFFFEALARGLRGLHTYDALPDDPRAGPALFRDARGTARGNPGWGGHFVHREFPGVRVEINALGLRDGSDEVSLPAIGTPHVLCLGDSFTYGLGVGLEQTFQEHLEELLGPGPARVTGAGIPGFGLRDERLALHELAALAAPDVVVLALFEGNDFQDTRSARERGPMEGPLVPGSVLPPPEPAPLVRFLRTVRTAEFWSERSAALQLGSSRGTGLPSLFMKEALEGDPAGRVAPLVEAYFEELAAFASEVRGLGAELVVLLVPGSVQAEPARFARYARRSAAPLDRTRFHATLLERLERSGYLVVDPLPLFERADSSGYHVEGHWNALGHERAARALAPVLRELLGLEGD